MLADHKRSKRTDVFSKEAVSPQNSPLDTQIAFLTSLVKNFSQKIDNSSLIKVSKKSVTFPKNSHNSSSGHIDFIFDNPVEFFCQKSEMFSLKIRKRWKTLIFFKKHFLLNSSPGHPVCIFDKLTKPFPPENGEFLTDKVWKWGKEIPFFQKKNRNAPL